MPLTIGDPIPKRPGRKRAQGNKATKRKDLTISTYDLSRCMFCGLCEDVWPVDALELTHDFKLATYTREGRSWDRQVLEEGLLSQRYTH